MSKPSIVILNEHPLRVSISKNGRPVSKAVATASLKKRFPDVAYWVVVPGDHDTGAYQLSACHACGKEPHQIMGRHGRMYTFERGTEYELPSTMLLRGCPSCDEWGLSPKDVDQIEEFLEKMYGLSVV